MKKMKTKYVISVSIIFSLLSITEIFAQDWIWSTHAGGNNVEFPVKMCSDNANNFYIAGSYMSNPCYFSTDTLLYSSSSNGGFYITKYNSSGIEQWVIGKDATNSITISATLRDITYDKTNNYIYVIGSFTGTGTLKGINLSSTGTRDILLAKFDMNGNCLWAKHAGGTGACIGLALASNDSGEIIITGMCNSAAMFDTITMAAGYFIAKYDTSGNCLWAKKKFNTNTTGQHFDGLIYSLKSKGGDIFATGFSTVGNFIIDTVTVNNQFNNGQNFIARFDGNGNAKWIRNCASDFEGGDYDIVVDDSLNSFVTGSFTQTGYFGNDTIYENNLWDLFLAKYDSSGNIIWVRQSNPSSGAAGWGVALDPERGVYLTGTVIGNASFGTFNISSSANGDMFLARYDANGNCIGVRQTGWANGNSVSVDNNGDVGTAGQFFNTVTFSPTSSLTSYGQQDIYIAKIGAITGLGEEERVANNKLLIYANPSKGTCNVTIPDEFRNEKNLTLQIFDNTGKLLQQTRVAMQQEKIKINLQEEAKGLYNVTLSNGKKSYNGKIVFE